MEGGGTGPPLLAALRARTPVLVEVALGTSYVLVNGRRVFWREPSSLG